ncbi:MAG TPA: energy transducer TonB [Sphingomicrobium sp.]|nr:energy transducer TonB [Sphingomicrobium sp.]
MRARSLLIAVGLMAAGPALAETPGSKAALNASNWDALLKFYPPRALAARQEGAVGFRVTLDSKGLVTGCEVTHSSGHPLLDQETCNVVALHTVFKAEQPNSGSQVRTHEGMIAWKLPASTSKLAVPQTAEASPLDKVICKKSVKTGTLAGVERTCLTAREWGRQSDDTREFWSDLQGRKGSTSGN